MSKTVSPTASRLHLGCGLNAPEGWVNVDGSWNAWVHQHPRLRALLTSLRLVSPSEAGVGWSRNILIHDLRKRLPFADDTFECVYASHMLEHLYRDDAERLVGECHRVLRTGGLIRLVVPDLKALVEDYLAHAGNGDGTTPAADCLQEAFLLREKERPRHGPLRAVYHAHADFHTHKWLYDENSLSLLLKRAGFRDIRRCRYLESRIAAIREVEDEGRLSEGTLCLEAEKA
jgi:predicted SAM-dependent methyltransferase